MPATGSSLQGFGTTVGNGGQPTPMPVPGPSGGARGILIGLGAAAALGLGGFIAYRTVGTPPQPPPQPAALTLAPPVPAAPAEAKPRTVKVVVLPGDATVEVDGTRATPNEGAVEVTGALGSVHKVRIKSGDAEILRDVVVTEGGAIPPKVELVAQVTPATPATAKPVVGRGPLVKPSAAPTALPLRQQR